MEWDENGENERRKVNNLLDPHTRPTTLCEGDEISIEPYSFLSSSNPAIGIERFRIREDGTVHVYKVGGLAYRCLLQTWGQCQDFGKRAWEPRNEVGGALLTPAGIVQFL